MGSESIKPPSAASSSEWDVRNPFREFDFGSYLKEELTQSVRKKQEQSGADDRGPFNNRVYTFVTVPKYFESFMTYGLLQCLDQLLVIYTFLPLRCTLTVLRLVAHILMGFPRFFRKSVYGRSPLLMNLFDMRLLYSHEVRDLVRFSLLWICTILLLKVDSSVAYHEIRTQSVIKIYIFFNLLEVADRLLSAVCQDALDDLLHTSSRLRRNCSWANGSRSEQQQQPAPLDNPVFPSRPGDTFGLVRDLLFQYCFALICLFAHCFLLLCQVTTLNVAFNSQNKSLVTVFISNNFVELKGNVFRKMGKTNLFQIACADVRERFHYGIWLFIVVCRNMTDTGWNLDDLWPMLFDVLCIFLAEVAVDWIKHSFITKFNVIPSDVYKEYTVSIAYDLLLCRQGKNTSDYFDLLSRRMGLTPIPLSCLINVMILQTVRNPGYVWCCLPVIVFMLFATKIVTNMALLSFAYAYVKAYIKAMSTAQAEASGTQQQTHVDATSAKIADVDNVRLVDDEPHPAKRRVLPEHQAHTRLIPVRYTGYDQPTGDEEQFLPMVLRHRRVRSESGCESSPTSVVKDMLGVGTAQVELPIDGNLLRNDRSAATSSKCFLTHSTPYATSSRGIGERLDDDVSMFAQSETNDHCRSLLVLSGDSPIRLVSRPASSLSNPNRSRLDSEHFSSNSVVSASEGKPPMGRAELFAPVSASSSFLSPDEAKLDYAPGAIVEPNPLVMHGEHSLKNSSLFPSTLPRCYSIDLGVLSGFSRLAILCPTPVYPEVTVMVEPKVPVTRPIAEPCVPHVDQQSQTEPLFPRRRKRTRTEGSGIDVPRTVLDERLPIMWERSNRNSVVQQFEAARMMIKQPLSDVDRYSMIEGQIS